MSIEEFPRSKTGFFHIGTVIAPADPQVEVHLTVTGTEVTGVAEFSQPPIRFHNNMTGNMHLMVFGADVRQIYSLQGVQPDPLGYWIMSMVIVLDGLWGTKGTASYTYLTPQKKQVKVESQPVTVMWPQSPHR